MQRRGLRRPNFHQLRDTTRAGLEEPTQANGDPDRIVRAGSWQQEPELVPAQTGDHAVAPDLGDEDFAHDPQDLVTDVVAMGVVDLLEVVDIDHREVRRRRAARARIERP
jgi:hypothetical protein